MNSPYNEDVYAFTCLRKASQLGQFGNKYSQGRGFTCHDDSPIATYVLMLAIGFARTQPDHG